LLHSASSPFQVNRRNNPRVTCFNCGVRGHYSDSCTHTPATAYEQQQIRDRVHREREQVEYDNRVSERRTIEPPLSGANTIEITPRAILPRPSAEKDFSSAIPSAATQVSCVRSCTVSRQDLGNACMVAARIPAVRTIFENALAEKRARVDDNDLESTQGQRATKVVRRMGELGESSVPRRSLHSTNNPRTYRHAPEITTVTQPDRDEESVIVVHHPDDPQEEEQNEDMDEETEDRYSPITIPLTSSREKVEMAPIKWMKGQAPFTIEDALNGPTPSLSITLPQLLDCSPRLRRDLAELLRSSVPRVRKKKATNWSGITEPASLHSSKLTLGHEVTREASPGTEGDIECLYIEAWVGNYKIPEVLVDAGGMLDRISTQLVDKLRLERFPVTGLGMRLADDRLVVLKNYVWLDIVVAGVLARIKAY